MINYTGIFAREIVNQIINEEINLKFLGAGSNGSAYKFDNKVIKFTNSDGEFECVKRLKLLQDLNPILLDYTSNVIAYDKLLTNDMQLLGFNKKLKLQKSYKYIIITDYLNTNKSLQNYFSKVFGEIFKYCFINKYSLTEVIKNNENHNFSNDDCNKLLIIMQIEKLIGAQDLHSGNIGYDENGNLKGFDFDFKNNI